MHPVARGRRVSAWLDVLGWSRARLGEQIGEEAPQVTRLLNGTKKGGIGPVDAWRMARALGLTEAYILYGDRRGLPPEVLRLLPRED
jgi:transcriptional regulator with XRE-family HTH domain